MRLVAGLRPDTLGGACSASQPPALKEEGGTEGGERRENGRGRKWEGPQCLKCVDASDLSTLLGAQWSSECLIECDIRQYFITVVM